MKQMYPLVDMVNSWCIWDMILKPRYQNRLTVWVKVLCPTRHVISETLLPDDLLANEWQANKIQQKNNK